MPVEDFAQGGYVGKMPFGTDVRKETLQGLNVFARVVRNGCDSSVRRREPEINQFDVRAIPGDKDIIRL